MSSSKIFKNDPSFTPVSLISEKITPDFSEEDRQVSTPPPEKETPAEMDGKQSAATTETSPPPQTPLPDIDAIRAEAYAQGKLEGQQSCQEDKQAQLSELRSAIKAFTQACSEVDNLHEELLEQSHGDMINLVIALSRKIIGREVATGRDVIADTLQNAIAMAMKHDEYDIWVNPDDLAVVEKMVPDLINSMQQLNHVTLKTDKEILRGGCRLDSDICTVDATIEAQLQTARELFEEKNSSNDIRPDKNNGDNPSADM